MTLPARLPGHPHLVLVPSALPQALEGVGAVELPRRGVLELSGDLALVLDLGVVGRAVSGHGGLVPQRAGDIRGRLRGVHAVAV